MTILLKKATETQSSRLSNLKLWHDKAVQENNLWAAKLSMHFYNRLKYGK